MLVVLLFLETISLVSSKNFVGFHSLHIFGAKAEIYACTAYTQTFIFFSISDESNGLLNRTTSDDQTSQNTTLPSPSGEALGLPSPSLSHEQQTPPKKPPRLNSTPQQLSSQPLHFRGSTIPDLSPVRTVTKATKQVHGDHDGVSGLSGLKNKQTLKAQVVTKKSNIAW